MCFEKSKFIKEQGASGLLSSLGHYKTPLSQIPLVGPFLFLLFLLES